MIIVVDTDRGLVTLEGPSEFNRFHVEVRGQGVGLTELLAPYARVDGTHVWVDLNGLVVLAGEAANDHAWRLGFDRMVAYAQENGFVDEDGGAIRAHLERG